MPQGSSTPSAPRLAALIPIGRHQGKPQLPIDRTAMLIGSRAQCHLHLVSDQVGQTHAILVKTEHGVYLRDLASRTGVLVNGASVREIDLHDGDQIRIGPFQFQFSAGSDQSLLIHDDPADPATLEVDGAHGPVPIQERVVLVGHRTTCDITLLEDNVQHCHAVIFQSDGRRYLRDLGSLSGTFVNGVRIHQTALNSGDEIRIGQTHFLYRSRSPRPATPAAEPPPLAPSRPAQPPPPSAASAPTAAVAVPPPDADQIDLDGEPSLSGLADTIPLPPAAVPPVPPVPQPVASVSQPPAPAETVIESILPPSAAEVLHPRRGWHAWQPEESDSVLSDHDAEPPIQPVSADPPPPTPVAQPTVSVDPAGADRDMLPVEASASADEPMDSLDLESQAVSSSTEAISFTAPAETVVSEPIEPEQAVSEQPLALEPQVVSPPVEETTPLPDTVLASAAPAMIEPERPQADAISTTEPTVSEQPLALESQVVSPPVEETAPLPDTVLASAAPAAFEPQLPPAEAISTTESTVSEQPLALEAQVVSPPVEETAPLPDTVLASAAPMAFESQLPQADAFSITEPTLSGQSLALEPLTEGFEVEVVPPIEPMVEPQEPVQEDAAVLPLEPLAEPPVEMKKSVADRGKIIDAAEAVSDFDKPARAVPPRGLRSGKKQPPAEVIERTEPTPESALGLDSTVAPVEPPSAPSAELTDTHFGRAMEALSGDASGPLVEQPAAPPMEEIHFEVPPEIKLEMPAVEPLDLGEPAIAAEPEQTAMPPEPSMAAEEPVARPQRFDRTAEFERSAMEAMRKLAESAVAPPPVQAPSLPTPPTRVEIEVPAVLPVDLIPPLFPGKSEVVPRPAVSAAGPPVASPLVIPPPAPIVPRQPLVLGPGVIEVGPLGVCPPAGPSITEGGGVFGFHWGANQLSFLGGGALPLEDEPRPKEFGKVQLSFGSDREGKPLNLGSGETPPPPMEFPPELQQEITALGELSSSDLPGDPGGFLLQGRSSSMEPGIESQFLNRPVPPPASRRMRMSSVVRTVDLEEQSEADAMAEGIDFGPAGIAGLEGLPPTAGAFEGLAPPQVREVDVFSGQMDDNPLDTGFGSENPTSSPVEFVLSEALGPKEVEAALTSALDVPANDFWAGSEKQAAGASQRSVPPRRPPGSGGGDDDSPQPRRVRPSARRTPVSLPSTRRPPTMQALTTGVEFAPRRSRVLAVPVLMILMLLCMAGAAVVIHLLVLPRSQIDASMVFRNFDGLTIREQATFKSDQQKLLESEPVRSMAKKILADRYPTVSGGFLEAPGDTLQAVANTRWPDDRKGVFQISYEGQDPKGDQARMESMLAGLYSANQGLVDAAAGNEQLVQMLSEKVARISQQIDRYKTQIEEAKGRSANRPDPDRLAQLEAEAVKAEAAWTASLATVKNAQAELDQMRLASGSDGAAASAQKDAASDPQLQQMSNELSQMTAKLNDARSVRTLHADDARKALDAAMAQFQAQVAAAQDKMKDYPQLTAYLAAAQTLQETTRQRTADMVKRQQELTQRLTELKSRLNEEMAARRNEVWRNDKDLQDLRQQLELTQRQYNAAVDIDGADPKQVAALKADIDKLTVQVKDRQDALGNDQFYADAVNELQQIIDSTRQQLETDRKQADQVMDDLQRGFQASSPAVEKLSDDQKALAEQMSQQANNLAVLRRQYEQAVGLGGASGADDSADLRGVQDDIDYLQTRMDQRRKELEDQTRKSMSEQQRLARLKAMDAQRAQLTLAQKAEAAAQVHYFDTQRELRDTQTALAAARAEADKLHDLTEEQQRQENYLASCQKQLDNAKREIVRSVAPLPPTSADVLVSRTINLRGTYQAFAMLVIAGLFTFLILLSFRSAPHGVLPPIVQPAAAVPPGPLPPTGESAAVPAAPAQDEDHQAVPV